MTSSRTLSRTTDYLGDLGAKLRDLQGYATLAHELIQNADDAPANWMSFTIRTNALVLDNDGVFAGCDDVEDDQCTWTMRGNSDHRCDFHRFRLIGSGDKRLQEGTTGAFGIGFISVYQLTDEPQLISAERHWVLHEERPPDQRIDVCSGCSECGHSNLPGTRFILPFARDENTFLRRALRAEPVPEDVTERLLKELKRCLPVAMLFLKNLKTIEVNLERHLRLKFEREVDQDTLLISQGDSANDRVWHLLRGNFEEPAQELRSQHPGRIEAKRSSEVVVALPQEEWSAGLLCACLPTEESPGLPFHINADFFPSNDRKRVILGNDYQSLWNREALLAAARTVSEAVPHLTGLLGPERFWHLADTLRELARDSGDDGQDSVWEAFWESLQGPLKAEAVIPTSSGDWTTAGGGVSLLQNEDEVASIPVLEGLGIDLVSEDLRRYQPTLRSVGVPYFDIQALCSALTALGLDKPTSLDHMPPCLASGPERGLLWSEINILLTRLTRTPQVKRVAEERLRQVSLAPTLNKTFSPFKRAVRADSPTVELFVSMGLDIPFLDHTATAFDPLALLCPLFGVADAVEALENAYPSSIEQLWSDKEFSIRSLIEWFEMRPDQITNNVGLRNRLAALPIYPSTNGRLHPLTSLTLPGDFEDPFKLTNLVDVEVLGRRREFLLDLGANNLSFRTFVRDYLPAVLNDESSNPDIRNGAVYLLAERIGELRDDSEIRALLSSLPIVLCTDGECRRPDECYYSDEVVHDILGQQAHVALLPPRRDTAVRDLLDWLGTERIPRLHDVVNTVRGIAGRPCAEALVLRIQRIVAHLSRRFQDRPIPSQLEALRTLQWLPARGDRNHWHQPNALHAPYQSYLFESQAAVLDVPQSTSREFLEFLGVHVNPSPGLVVKHLLYCAELDDPVNTEVYRFLNDNAGDPALDQLKSKKCLWLGQSYRSAKHVFWSDHPFGQYRWRLADNLRGFGRLLEGIGVTDAPDHHDAIEVLREISLESGTANNPLDDETYRVSMICWQMLEEALDTGRITEELLENLGKVKSISNSSNVLYLPTWLFFENRAGLADKFASFLQHNVISRPLRASRAFLAAGVRQLGSAVEIELVRNDEPLRNPEIEALLLYRVKEIARVLASQMVSQNVQTALERLRGLECKSASSLVLQYRLSAFDNVVKSRPERVPAVYELASHCLWTTRQDGRLQWAPVAREIAIALCPEEDPGLFAAGLKEVLAAETITEAATSLDELGFSQLDTTVIEPPVSSEAAGQLGMTNPVGVDGLPSHGEADQALAENEQEEQLQAPTAEEALRALGITQDPTPPVSTPPEPTTISSSAGNAGVGGQPSDHHGAERTGVVGAAHNTVSGVKTQSGSRAEANTRPGRKFVSYVSLSPSNEEEPDPDGLTQLERYDLEEKAIKKILEEEPRPETHAPE